MECYILFANGSCIITQSVYYSRTFRLWIQMADGRNQVGYPVSDSILPISPETRIFFGDLQNVLEKKLSILHKSNKQFTTHWFDE